MKRKVDSWTIEKIDKERPNISFPEYQRQPRLWSEEKKVLLIDSIFNEVDIPKLYFNQTNEGYEVLDGQQRLWAIWDFLDDLYPYKVNDTQVKYSELTDKQQAHIKDYELQITVIQNADDDYLRKLFIRLQFGLPLITGEKLHVATGKMKEFVFDKLAKQDFIVNLSIPERRFAKETLCGQIAINSFMRAKLGTFARTRYEDLQYFVQEYAHPQGKDLTFFNRQTVAITTVMGGLSDCLGERTGELRNRSYILSVYLFFEELTREKSLSKKEEELFSEFILTLWRRLKEEMEVGFDRKNRELYSFETLVSSAPGEKYQIERRHGKLIKYYDHFRQEHKIKGD